MNALVEKIEKLKEKIGIKGKISEYGVDKNEFLSRLENLSTQAFDDQCTGANPRYPLIDEIKEIYLKIF
jgi:acetaldehyde dehydrogenase/alcohol dehydrogenase